MNNTLTQNEKITINVYLKKELESTLEILKELLEYKELTPTEIKLEKILSEKVTDLQKIIKKLN